MTPDLRRERLFWRRVQGGFPRAGPEDQLVVALEVEVDELAALPQRFLTIGADKGQVVLDGGHLPDHIVAVDQPSQKVVEPR
jgi:hypothetical protein